MKDMKWKTRILSALIHIAVFAVCIGALYFLTKITGPQMPEKPSPDQETMSQDQEETKGTDWEPEDAGNDLEEEERQEEKEQNFYEGQETGQQPEPPVQNIPEPYEPPSVILATDLHYQSHKADDGGEAFQNFVAKCDGKVVEYLPELLEAFLEEVVEKKPSALVLSGDITMNGEQLNHQELAEMLENVRQKGIPVLVIPGNHDINNTNAAFYIGKEKTQAPSVTAQEFLELYHAFGYDQAFSRDQSSLSYAYALDEKNWLLMLDSAQYDPVNLVEGRIQDETLEWMRGILEEAEKQGIFVLPIAHHNLLAQSRMYTTQCIMENNQQVIELLEEYGCPLFMSGHLHVQRIHKHKLGPGTPDEAYGIQEIVTDALSIPPCQYGQLEWKEDGSLEYSTASVNVSAWASRTGSENPDLLNFEQWSQDYISSLISSQIAGDIRNMGEEITWSMAHVYAQVYIDYYAGRLIDSKEIKSTKGYFWWQRNLPDSKLLGEIEAMMADAVQDYNNLQIDIDGYEKDHRNENGKNFPQTS